MKWALLFSSCYKKKFLIFIVILLYTHTNVMK